jgi:ribosome hibernation promoting factor
MDVIIQGHNLRVSDALENYARKKMDKLDRYLPNIHDVRIDLSSERTKRGEDLAIAQITIRHSRGAILRAEERSQGDINAAINSAVEKMYRRIQRFKGKRIRKGRERFTATLEELNASEQIPDMEVFEDVSEAEAEEQEIVRRKEVPIVAMNEAEAIEQLELLGHSFLVFFNDATGGVNVLYKRTSGGYGVIVPRLE